MHYCDDCTDKDCIARETKGISHCHQKRTNPFVAKPQGSKYKNKTTYIGGIRFDSKKEAERYIYLKDREKCGEITNLVLQPKFILLEDFKHNGKTIRGITYKADFSYYDKALDKTVIEDVKGMKTQVYRMKYKMMLGKGLEVVEI